MDVQMLDLDVIELCNELSTEFRHRSKFPYAFTGAKSLDIDYMVCCPYHSEQRASFGIEKSYPYRYQCWSCGETGTVLALVDYCLGFNNPSKALAWLFKSYRSFAQADIKIDLYNLFTDESKNRPIIDHRVASGYVIEPHHPWIIQRGFLPEVLSKFQIGFDPLVNAITIPIWDSKGNLRYIKRRLINPPFKGDKYLNVAGVFKRDIVYPLHLIKKAGIREVYVVEGEFNAISMYQAGFVAVAIGTSKITDEQVKEMVKAGINHAHIMFDNDSAGREGIGKALDKLSPYMLTDVVYMPNHFNDQNDMLRAGCLHPLNLRTQLNKKFKMFL